MTQTIELTRLSNVWPGEHIAHVDDDELETSEAVNRWYQADEQDWQVVVKVRGHADVGELLLQAHDGSREWHPVTWSGKVWRLRDEHGPVKHDFEEE